MRRWNDRQELVFQVVTLRRQGLSRHAIARTLSVSRNTVRKILRQQMQARTEPHIALETPPKRAPRAKKTDPYRSRVEGLMAKYPSVTAQRVFEIIGNEGYQGGYTVVKELVRALRPKVEPKASLQSPDWGPGKMAESDWSPYLLELKSGRMLKVQLFSYVLAHSKRKHYEAFDSCDLHAMMDGHVGAFERFGGVAERCKYDGQAVVARWEGNQPIYNPRFLAFCAHYEMRPWAQRGNPNRRPNVERSFWTHERSFLVAREFVDLDDFRRQLRQWLKNTVDPRPYKGRTTLERFAEEAPHLVPLPLHPFDTARVVYRICSIDGFVDYQGNRYAVPYDHVTDFLPLRITERELFIYAADFSCIASYELAERSGYQDIDPNGFHRRQGQAAISLEQVGKTYESIGTGAETFFRHLSDGPSRCWSAPARRILTLRERYATDDIDAALAHAARYGALQYDSVERILEARFRPRRLDDYIVSDTARALAKLGYPRTQRSNLAEYDRIPGALQNHDEENPDANDSHATTSTPPQGQAP
jgi:transposase